MADEFCIPGEPEELWAPDSELAFRCENFTDLSEGASEDVGEIAESALLPAAPPFSTAAERQPGDRRPPAGRSSSPFRL